MTTPQKFGLLLLTLAVFMAWGGGGSIVPSQKLIDYDGLAVLVVEETAERNSLPVDQMYVVLGDKWEDYVTSKGGTVLTVDKDLPAVSPTFQSAFERPRASVPWCIVSGRRSYEGPLPANADAMLALVKEHE